MAKKKKIRFHILNIKLNKEGEVTPESYAELIEKLFQRKEAVPTHGSDYVMFRTLLKRTINDTEFYYGRISRFTKIDGKQWLDFERGEAVTFELPENLFPNLRETQYLFVPSAHRLCLVEDRNNVSVTAAYKYLDAALNKVIAADEAVSVRITTSTDGLERIINAEELYSLDFTIEYSNNDLNDAMTQQAEKQIKDAGFLKLSIKGKSRAGSKLDLEKNEFILGSLGLVPDNGAAKASILEDGRKKTVDTDNYPRKEEIIIENVDDEIPHIFNRLMSIYRR